MQSSSTTTTDSYGNVTSAYLTGSNINPQQQQQQHHQQQQQMGQQQPPGVYDNQTMLNQTVGLGTSGGLTSVPGSAFPPTGQQQQQPQQQQMFGQTQIQTADMTSTNAATTIQRPIPIQVSDLID